MIAFQDALHSKDFVITAELPLHPAQDVDDLIARFRALRPVVDGVQVGDNEDVEGHISPLAIARIAIDNEVDPVVHLGCRDRNRIALQSEILGAAALGATSLLLKRGNKLPSALRGRVKSVFDCRATQLLTMAARISESSSVVPASGLLLGAYVTVIEPDKDWQAGNVIDKIDAGAGFLQSRPCLDMDRLAAYAASLVALRITHRASMLASIPFLTSPADARKLVERYPDATIPDTGVQRLAAAADGEQEGIRMLSEALQAAAAIPGVSGANIIYLGDEAPVVMAIRDAGLR